MADATIDTPGSLGRAVRGLRGLVPGRRRRAVPPSAAPLTDGLDAAQQAALEQLGAADGYATRWAVGREVARSLASRQLVVVASDYVLLTEAGRRALTAGGARDRD